MGEKGKETIEKTIRSGGAGNRAPVKDGEPKSTAVSEAKIEKGYGIRGDAHAGTGTAR